MTYKKIIILFILFWGGKTGSAQPAEFSFFPSISAAVFIGQIEVNGMAAQAGDWLAAFGPDGNCAGASQLIFFDGKAYANLTIYGDDQSTSEDEGLNAGESFRLQLYRAVEQDFLDYPEIGNPVYLEGWVNNNGAPLADYNDPEVIFNFQASSPLAFSVLSSNPTCADSTNGTIDLLVTGGTSPYYYLWSDGVEDESNRIELAGGTYQCTITDSGGTEIITDPILLESPAPILVSAVIGLDTCAAGKGSIMLGVEGGTMPYSYSWNEGGQSAVITDLQFGDYLATITDSFGCTSIWEGEVIATPPYQTEVALSPVSCSGGMDGSAEVLIDGGEGPFLFSWSTGENVAAISNLSAGSYSVTIADGFGCETIDAAVIEEPTALSGAVTTMAATDGQPNGSASISVSGGVPPYDYFWNDANMQTTVTAESLLPGTYTVSVTDNNGCLLETEVLIENLTGTSFLSKETMELVVFPNPLSTINQLHFSQNQELVAMELWNSAGIRVSKLNWKAINSNQYQFTVGRLPHGLYLLKVVTTERVYITSLVI